MVEKSNTLIEIDLNQFKLHIRVQNGMELSLHFNSPSRKFYLSVIALVVTEMKKLGKVTSIPLESHYDTLALLNETIGERAGSSDRKNLLRRIYRKWKDALPDLEHAPLFTIPGRRKEYGDAIGKMYPFSDEEKDAWANLFEYKGSLEDVRLRFSLDRLGATLDQVVVTYGQEPNLSDEDSWDRFTGSLEQELYDPDSKDRVPVAPTPRKRSWRRPWPAVLGVVGLLLVGGAIATWYLSYRTPKSVSYSMFPIKSPLPLPDKPSIAVLPFANIGNAPEQEYFSDGLVDEIITALSKVPHLFIIARNSTFTYKDKPVKVQQVAEELGVRYVLEGSVRRVGDRMRITAQLIDGISGHHLWGERYDAEMRDIFALQDKLTMKIITALRVQLTEGEQALVYMRGTTNLEAYLKVLEARRHSRRLNPTDNLKARQLAQEAIALDPNYPMAYSYLGSTHVNEIWMHSAKSREDSLRKGAELAQKALSMDESLGYAHYLLAQIHVASRDFKKGIAEAQRAIELEPNGEDFHWWLGAALVLAGRLEEGIKVVKKAIRLNPYAPGHYFHTIAMAYRNMGLYDEAIGYGEKAVERSPKSHPSRRVLISCYSLAGRDEEARSQAKELLKMYPEYCVKNPRKGFHKNPAFTERILNSLRKAGVPDCPPSPGSK